MLHEATSRLKTVFLRNKAPAFSTKGFAQMVDGLMGKLQKDIIRNPKTYILALIALTACAPAPQARNQFAFAYKHHGFTLTRETRTELHFRTSNTNIPTDAHIIVYPTLAAGCNTLFNLSRSLNTTLVGSSITNDAYGILRSFVTTGSVLIVPQNERGVNSGFVERPKGRILVKCYLATLEIFINQN